MKNTTPKPFEMLIITEKGWGKRTIVQSNIKKRMATTSKTGNIIFAAKNIKIKAISLMTDKNQPITLETKEIPVLGQMSQGVRLMKLEEGEKITNIIII